MLQKDQQKIHLDDVLQKFGLFDRYHFQMMLIFILGFGCDAISTINYIFITEKIDYTCADPEFANDTCGVINSRTCPEFIYEKSNSFVADFQLGCQDWKRTLVGTADSTGHMVGLLLVGPLSDRFGRKSILVVTTILCGIIGFTKSFVTSYWLYITLQFFEPILGAICSPNYILMAEIVTAKRRVPYYLINTTGFILGSTYKAILAYFIADWRFYVKILYTPLFICFFIFMYMMDESPRWLLIRKRKQEAVEIIKKIAKSNKVEIEKSVLDNLSSETDEESNENVKLLAVLKSTFTSKALMLRFLVCVVWWLASVFVNFGLSITSVSQRGNKYINNILVEVARLPASVLGLYLLTKYKRKFPLIWCFFIAAVICVGQPFSNDITWLAVTLFTLGKFVSNIFFNITYVFTSELFPTYTRNSMFSLCSSLGRIGMIIAPQLPLLMVYWEGIPALLFGIVSLIAGLVTFLVPDTAEVPLPDTVKEAEAIGSQEMVQNKSEMALNHIVHKDGVRNRAFENTE